MSGLRRLLRWLLGRLERPMSRTELERLRYESDIRIARGLRQSRELAEELRQHDMQ